MIDLYMVRDGVRYGPFPEPTVRLFIAERKLVPSDMVWFAGMQAWAPASVALAGWFPATPPMPPPLPSVYPTAPSGAQILRSGPASASIFDRIQDGASTYGSPFASELREQGALPAMGSTSLLGVSDAAQQNTVVAPTVQSGAETAPVAPDGPQSTRQAQASGSPWARHVERLKGMVGADKLIDPQRISDSLAQKFQWSERPDDQGGDGVVEGEDDYDNDGDQGWLSDRPEIDR